MPTRCVKVGSASSQRAQAPRGFLPSVAGIAVTVERCLLLPTGDARRGVPSGSLHAAAPSVAKRVCRVVTVLAFAVVFVNTETAASGPPYYISSSQGDDSNAGTSPVAPWKSLDRIYLKSVSKSPFRPGDAILLKAGDTWYGNIYEPNPGTAAAPIVIGSYGHGAKPVIYGDNENARWTPVQGHAGIYSTYVGVHNVIDKVYQGTTNYPSISPGGIPFWKGGASLDAYLNTFIRGSYGPSTATNTIYVKTLDGQAPVNMKLFNHSLVSVGSFVTVENLDLRRSFCGFDLTRTDHVVIANNSVQDTLGIGIYLRIRNTNALVEKNAITRTGNDAIYVLEGHYNTVRGNTVSHVTNSVLGVRTGGDLCAIGLQESSNNLVEYNAVSYARGSAVDYYYEKESAVRYNYCYHTGGAAYPHGTGLRVYGNIFHLDGAGNGMNARNTGTSPIHVFNNVFYATKSFGIMGGARVKFRNNIVVGRSSLVVFTSVSDSDYNCYCSRGADAPFNWSSRAYSFSQYRRASGLDQHSVFADPMFVAANPFQAGDFRLRDRSPCIDRGLDLKRAGFLSPSDSYRDLLGTTIPQGNGADIGAYEYVPKAQEQPHKRSD